MITDLILEDLVAFEERVADAFNSGKIRAPVHLYSGNEVELINVFSDVDSEDWVLCSWRSHYQCLLKGVPQEQVFNEILAGRSISLCFADYKIFSSAIVGGVLPIAIGIAFSIKRAGGDNRVHCFLGDMTAETGIAHECIKYATNFDLPIRFIIEDNGLSVCTDTRSVWGDRASNLSSVLNQPNVVYYKYQSAYPHAGAGVRVQF
ncbi:MAG: thiamine pyrophosphate-dependent enzyme [Arenicellales bacterium]